MFDLQRFLRRMDWTQAQLSKATGIPRTKICGWSAGYRTPDYDNLCRLLSAGMTLSEAFGPELEEKILRSQPTIDISAFTPEDCRKIVSMALGSIEPPKKGGK